MVTKFSSKKKVTKSTASNIYSQDNKNVYFAGSFLCDFSK